MNPKQIRIPESSPRHRPENLPGFPASNLKAAAAGLGGQVDGQPEQPPGAVGAAVVVPGDEVAAAWNQGEIAKI